MTQEGRETIDGTPIDDSHSDVVRVIEDDEELLRYGICRARVPDGLDAERWAKELSRVTPMSLGFEGDNTAPLYRNIMDEPEFPLGCLLQEASDIGGAVLRHFPLDRLSELRLDDAFCVHYDTNQDDTTGARHTDPSDVTVNICLQKSDDAEGSHVLFHGTRRLENVPAPRDGEGLGGWMPTVATTTGRLGPPERFLVRQEAGYATIHYGDHPHETTALRRGSRTNIVATFWYTDPGRSDVATRTCY